MQDFQDHYTKLNSEQKKAVDTLYGPIMVVAGPGTGKTQIIAMRTANILLKTDTHPENILITTFTEAGVIALKKRLLSFIGTDAYKVKISTIHSFAQDIISEFPEKFITQRAGSTIDDIESLEFFSEILDSKIGSEDIKYLFHPSDRMSYLSDIRARINTLKSEGVSPNHFDTLIQEQEQNYQEALESLKDNKRIRDLEKRSAKDKLTYDTHIAKLKELNILYRAYQQFLQEKSLYDFSDMINFVVEKMKTDEELLSYYGEKYQFVMLDEYQDTNNPQNEIMNLLMSASNDLPLNRGEMSEGQRGVISTQNIMVVGDDDQSIYRFQGANIENMLDFYTLYLETQFIVLKDNYRSAQSILDLSSHTIQNNSERLVNRLDFLDKSLTAQSGHTTLDQNHSYILPDDIGEKIFVCEKIKAHSTQESIAIIVRSNREVKDWTDFLISQGVELHSKLKTNVLSNPFVTFLLDLIQLIENPYYNDGVFLDILRSNIIDVDNRDIIMLARQLYQKNYIKSGFKLQVWDLIQDLKTPSLDISYHEIEKIITLRDTFLQLGAHTGNISTLLSQILEHFSIIEYIETHGSFSDLEDIFTLFNVIKNWNTHNPNLLLRDVIKKCELHRKYNILIPRQILKKTSSHIEILTAHSSKGLEYDHVYIPGCYGGNWEGKNIADKIKLPLGITGQGLQFADMDEKDIKAHSKEMNLQEDRRLFFVACTRAAQSLTFTRPAGKDHKPYIDSPFLVETGIESESIDSVGSDNILAEQLIGSMKTDHITAIQDEEIEYIAEFFDNYKLSATDLNTFLEDPLVFLKNAVFKYPFVDNEYTIFGKIYHRVLELATIKKQKGESLGADYMIASFELLLDKQVLSAEEKKRLLEKGREGLKGYYEIFQSNTRIPLQTEYNFRGKNITFEGIPLTGKVDAIFEVDNNSSEKDINFSPLIRGDGGGLQGALFTQSVAIVDYKTGAIKTAGNIKGIDRYGNTKPGYEHGKYYRQLMFYKLLCEHDRELSAQYTPVEFALDFVEGKNGDYQYQVIDIDPKDYKNFKILIQESWEQMKSIEFWKETLGK
ncbi:ATP-dependent helicase [Candidatus Gracilibacteria bacterium]|nr:ATP-dependent helicase [Candidatus Gracilibacteria bacterium]